MSSASDEWGTPQKLFDKLHDEFHFVLDVCATDQNTKCMCYITPEQNSLTRSWGSTSCHQDSFWMNPPYGKGIERWVEKAYHVSTSGVRVVALLPSRTNAPWWHDYVMKAHEIRFIRRKVSFEGDIKGVPFWGSVIVVFGPGLAVSGEPYVSSYDWERK